MPSKWVKTKVSLETYGRIEEYAKRHGLSIYAAVRELIEAGLQGSLDLLRLAEDEYILLMAVRYHSLRDPGFRRRGFLEALGEEL